ncbi:MAG: pyridoxine 5'-phosphate synthase, partial [Gemmatimonadota bacterium]
DVACDLRPMQATLVPEKREEITTEGGLDLGSASAREGLARALGRLTEAGVRTSLFIDPDEDAIRASLDLGADAVELHTGEYANAAGRNEREAQLSRLNAAASIAGKLGLAVHAGHGLTYENVTPVAEVPEIEELNIGHSIISRAVFTGMERAVRDMVELVRRARAGS